MTCVKYMAENRSFKMFVLALSSSINLLLRLMSFCCDIFLVWRCPQLSEFLVGECVKNKLTGISSVLSAGQRVGLGTAGFLPAGKSALGLDRFPQANNEVGEFPFLSFHCPLWLLSHIWVFPLHPLHLSKSLHFSIPLKTNNYTSVFFKVNYSTAFIPCTKDIYIWLLSFNAQWTTNYIHWI